MQDVTVNVPSVGTEAYFTFKEPINTFLKNKYNLDSLTVKLKVISVISMKDMIRNDFRDPFTELYMPSGLSEVEYKKDLIDNIPIVSFSFRDLDGVEKYIRSPLNYINSISNISDIEYINKLLVIDLNKLPVSLDISFLFFELSDYIKTRLGITPTIKEVNIGDVTFVSTNEHNTRETIRNNNVTVHKTLSVQLQEANLRYDNIMARLQELGIVLGE